ncbi:Tfx family DNA-binding protein [Halobellus ruber]|uniref:Tfx family DNA-binding protein n=1 Tax=Halobellus ruber TaxID=2761102 RepID=A0A7J9SJS4_9EURY|nr:Tfx family DNA-binding protein [Halobellus ruber]MBB6647165.1 Tfx family DNA-binding protein [Halobellus ruber]
MTNAERDGSDAPASEGGDPGGPSAVDDAEAEADPADADEALSAVGFDADESVLTRRQAEVLVLRERGIRQSRIASMLGTSRANVSSIESSARRNVEKARETVAFAEALTAPVRIPVQGGTDLYDVPKQVYDACDEAGVKVNRTAPELMKVVSDAAGDAIQGREVRESLLVGVTTDGKVQVRRSDG